MNPPTGQENECHMQQFVIKVNKLQNLWILLMACLIALIQETFVAINHCTIQ